jgi:hypothetical protein
MKLLIRHEIFLQRYSDTSGRVTKAGDDQIKKAAELIKRVDLKDFSVFQLSNPGKLLPLAQPLSLLNDIVFTSSKLRFNPLLALIIEIL